MPVSLILGRLHPCFSSEYFLARLPICPGGRVSYCNASTAPGVVLALAERLGFIGSVSDRHNYSRTRSAWNIAGAPALYAIFSCNHRVCSPRRDNHETGIPEARSLSVARLVIISIYDFGNLSSEKLFAVVA